MCNAVICFIEAKCVAGRGQATRRKWFKFVRLNIYCFRILRNIRECYRLEEMRQSYKLVQHCNGVTSLELVEN